MARQGSVALSSGGVTPVTDVTDYTEITASNNKGTFFLPIPAETPEGKKYRITVVAEDSIGNRSVATSMETITSLGFIVAPAVTSPVADSSVNYKNIIVTTSPFASSGLSDTHIASQFVLLANDGSEAVILDSGEVPTLRTHTFSLPDMPSIVDCKIQARHKGAIAGWSAMSEAVPCTVKDTQIIVGADGYVLTTADMTGMSGWNNPCAISPDGLVMENIVHYKDVLVAVTRVAYVTTFWYSEDEGDNWVKSHEINGGNIYWNTAYGNYFLREHKGILFYTVSAGILKSTDGRNWSVLATAPKYSDIQGMLSPLVQTSTHLHYISVVQRVSSTPSSTNVLINNLHSSEDGINWTTKNLDNLVNINNDACSGKYYAVRSFCSCGDTLFIPAYATPATTQGYFHFGFSYSTDNGKTFVTKKTVSTVDNKSTLYLSWATTINLGNGWYSFMKEGIPHFITQQGTLFSFDFLSAPPALSNSAPSCPLVIRSNLFSADDRWYQIFDPDMLLIAYDRTNKTILFSRDGITWDVTGSVPFFVTRQHLTYNYSVSKKLHYLFHNIWYSSTDGKTWNNVNPGVMIVPEANVTRYDRGGYIGGKFHFLASTHEKYVLEMDSSLNFKNSFFIVPTAHGLTYYQNGKLWTSDAYRALYRSDTSWSPTYTPPKVPMSVGMWYKNGTYVAITQNSSYLTSVIVQSTDLINWTSVGELPRSTHVIKGVSPTHYIIFYVGSSTTGIGGATDASGIGKPLTNNDSSTWDIRVPGIMFKDRMYFFGHRTNSSTAPTKNCSYISTNLAGVALSGPSTIALGSHVNTVNVINNCLWVGTTEGEIYKSSDALLWEKLPIKLPKATAICFIESTF